MTSTSNIKPSPFGLAADTCSAEVLTNKNLKQNKVGPRKTGKDKEELCFENIDEVSNIIITSKSGIPKMSGATASNTSFLVADDFPPLVLPQYFNDLPSNTLKVKTNRKTQRTDRRYQNLAKILSTDDSCSSTIEVCSMSSTDLANSDRN